MAGNNSIVNTGVVSIGATPEEKAMLLAAAGLTPAQIECQLEYGEYSTSDMNMPPVDGGMGHTDGGTLVPPQPAKGPYDNYGFTPINTKPRMMESE